MISLSGLVTVLVYIIVGGLIFALLFWLIQYCALPEPFNKVARVVLVVCAVLFLIGVLLSIVGGVPVFRP